MAAGSQALQTLLIAAALAAGIPFAHAADWDRKYTFQGPASVRLEATEAKLRIRGGDVKWMEAHVATIGWTIGDEGVAVVESQQEDIVSLGVRTPPVFFGVGARRVQVDLIVPRTLSLIARTGDGEVEAEGFGGDVHLNSGLGPIAALRMDGFLDAQTGDGGMNVSGRFERLNLKTRDGAIEVKLAEGSKVSVPWKMQTGGGDIRVVFAGQLACNVDAKTDEGRVAVEVPVEQTKRSGGSLRGQIGGGGQRLTMRTRAGTITLRRTGGEAR